MITYTYTDKTTLDFKKIFSKVREASRELIPLDDTTIRSILERLADRTEGNIVHILQENEKDLVRMSPDDPRYDRLKLTESRILGIAGEMRNVAKLPSPLRVVLENRALENGLRIEKNHGPARRRWSYL